MTLHEVPRFFWVMTKHSPFKLPKTHCSYTAPSYHIFTVPTENILFGSDSLKCQHKNITHRPGQKLTPPVKQYLCFQMGGETAHYEQCLNSHALTKVIHLIIDMESFENKCVIIKGLLKSD